MDQTKKKYFGQNNLTPQQLMTFTQGSLLRSCDVLALQSVYQRASIKLSNWTLLWRLKKIADIHSLSHIVCVCLRQSVFVQTVGVCQK